MSGFYTEKMSNVRPGFKYVMAEGGLANLPATASNICDEMWAIWPSVHNNHRCTVEKRGQKSKEIQFINPATQTRA